MQTEGQIASPTRTGREEQLQFLRFWAFFNVFVCHGEQWLFFKYPTSHCSTAAVSFFFMLSGLVTALVFYNKDVRLSWREEGKYLWHKVKKIYPLYLFTTLYVFLYTNTESLTALFDVQKISGAACAEPSAGAVMVCGGRVQLQRCGLVPVHPDVPVRVQPSRHVPAE